MSPDAVARTWFKQVWDEGDESAIDRLLASDGVAHGLGAADLVGPEAFKPYFRAMRTAFGDLGIEILQTVAEGDRVAVHCRVRGRHVGDSLGGAPTNRPVQFEGMAIVRVRDGQIVEGWNAFDFLAMYQQLGWVRNPPLPA